MFGMGHSAAVVGKFYEDLVVVIFRSDRKNSVTVFRKGPDAVGNQVQKHLHEAWPVSPHERQAGFYSPLCLDIFLLQGWGNHYFQFIKQSSKIDFGSLIAGLSKIDACDTFERDDEIAKSLEGTWQAPLLFVLKQEVEMYDTYLQRITECDRELEVGDASGKCERNRQECGCDGAFDEWLRNAQFDLAPAVVQRPRKSIVNMLSQKCANESGPGGVYMA